MPRAVAWAQSNPLIILKRNEQLLLLFVIEYKICLGHYSIMKTPKPMVEFTHSDQVNLVTVAQAEYCVEGKECGLQPISVKDERHCGSVTSCHMIRGRRTLGEGVWKGVVG